MVRERAELILVDSVLGAGTTSALDSDTPLVSLETVWGELDRPIISVAQPVATIARLWRNRCASASARQIYSHRMRLVLTKERVELDPVLDLETARGIDVHRLHGLTSLHLLAWPSEQHQLIHSQCRNRHRQTAEQQR